MDHTSSSQQYPQFFIHRNKNKSLIINAMNNINWEANDSTKDLSKPDALTMRQLAGMQLVARMKEAADKAGAGFVGGFIDENGNRFMMSNMSEEDIQAQYIMEKLEQYKREIEGDERG
jgi:hypothetical protein